MFPGKLTQSNSSRVFGARGSMNHTKNAALVGRLPIKLQKKIKEMSFKAVDEAASRFVHSVGLRFKASDWLHGNMPSEVMLEGDITDFKFFEENHTTSHFIPFVEKVIVPPGSKICVLGDVHGDLEYVVDVLQDLQGQGLVDGEYHCTDPSIYLVFLGDYTNRNHNSVEIMLLIFYLYRHNLGRVFLLRGNHEYAISSRVVYGMYQNFLSDYSAQESPNQERSFMKDALIAEMGRKFSMYQFPDLLYWFDFLPMAAYIGCYDELAKKNQYVNFCHGGIEPGYDAASFLASDARFDLMQSLDRVGAMQKLVKQNVVPSLDTTIQLMCNRLNEIGMQVFIQTFIGACDPVVDLSKQHNPRRLRLGMQWNSFLTENNSNLAFASSQRHRNFLFGRELTKYFFEQNSASGHSVIGIIRGHQHLDDHDESIGLDSPMLSQLREQNGIVRQWGGMVRTMGDGGSATGWQAFLVVTTGKTLADWKSQHFCRMNLKRPFEMIEQPFLDE